VKIISVEQRGNGAARQRASMESPTSQVLDVGIMRKLMSHFRAAAKQRKVQSIGFAYRFDIRGEIIVSLHFRKVPIKANISSNIGNMRNTKHVFGIHVVSTT
jgi:hypothetical protein